MISCQPTAVVAELQGIYGPFTFPEKLLQKIWLRRDFDRGRAFTTNGELVTVLDPGHWNLLGGPDFQRARIRVGERDLSCGDVELHLNASDWDAHGHVRDAAYDHVILHVVLFAPERRHVTIGRNGPIPVLPLLAILLHDLEEYAADDAVEALAQRPAGQIVERLGPIPRSQLLPLLQDHAAERWRQKVHFAQLRIRRLGWSEACHQTALEVLGYRFNRAPMLRIATRFGLLGWTRRGLTAETLFAAEEGGWSLQGIRPANHPRNRLGQYVTWVARVPRWPDTLTAFGSRLPVPAAGTPTAEVRHAYGFAALRAAWIDAICGGAVAATRFDTLACDGFLPLLAAAGQPGLFGVWSHWLPGDLPPAVGEALRQLGVFDGAAQPACHGLAQGLLGWLLAQEHRQTQSPGRGA